MSRSGSLIEIGAEQTWRRSRAPWLQERRVMATDLRASMGLILAGLKSEMTCSRGTGV